MQRSSGNNSPQSVMMASSTAVVESSSAPQKEMMFTTSSTSNNNRCCDPKLTSTNPDKNATSNETTTAATAALNAAAISNDELLQITRSQAMEALALTEPEWQVVGLPIVYEEPSSSETFDACVDRVASLLWIRLIAIGAMEQQPDYFGDDYSTTSICRRVFKVVQLRQPNPQDDNDAASSDDDEEDEDDDCSEACGSEEEEEDVTYGYGDDDPDMNVQDSITSNTNNTSKQRLHSPIIKQHEKKEQVDKFVSCWWKAPVPKVRGKKKRAAMQAATLNKPPARPTILLEQLRMFVKNIFRKHDTDLPFHNYTHAASVVIRCNKLLDLILCADDEGNKVINFDYYCYDDYDNQEERRPPTFGLRKNPILQMALLFAGLIHDVEHQGVTNRQLVNEEDTLALIYNDQSVQEKNSLKVAFEEFLQPKYADLKAAMFPTEQQYRLFRKTVVDAVLTTDIASPEQTVVTKTKWKEAFAHRVQQQSLQQQIMMQQPGGGPQYQHQQYQHQQYNNQNYPTPTQLNIVRRCSIVSDISLPHMASGTPPPQPRGGRRGSALGSGGYGNRRGSAVSNMTDITDDTYMRQQLIMAAQRRKMSISDYYYEDEAQQQQYLQQQQFMAYNRRGSTGAQSAFSTDSMAMKYQGGAAGNKSRKIKTQRRASNDSFGGQHYLQQAAATTTPQRGGGSGLYDYGDDASYDPSEFGTDSVPAVNNRSHDYGGMHRRMSNESCDSYEASDWGGDSVCKPPKCGGAAAALPNYYDDDSQDGVIQHRRFPHADSSDGNIHYNHHTGPPAERGVRRNRSMPESASPPKNPNLMSGSPHSNRDRCPSFSNASQPSNCSNTEETMNSYFANSVQINHKRLGGVESSPQVPQKSAMKNKKIMMETDDGEAIDISKYLWNEGNDSDSFSLTPPSSVEDEYGGYAAEYAAKFTQEGGGALGPDGNEPSNNSSKGEYCGRVIVATTTTAQPIGRRSSVSGYTPTAGAAAPPGGRPPVATNLNNNNNAFTPTGPRQRVSRRASTGNVPVKFGPIKGQRIDEDSPHDYHPNNAHKMAPGAASRRRTMGMMPQDGKLVGEGQAFDAQFVDIGDIKKYKKRLGIRRSMDLSGESIECYSRCGDEGSLADQESKGGHTAKMIDWDEPDDLRAAVVVEALLRAADVGHSLQNWENMTKWSAKLFQELSQAHEDERGHDPGPGWYENQIRIMDSYLRPLALQLDDTGVFGEFIGALFVQCLDEIRARWLEEGKDVTDELRVEAAMRNTAEEEEVEVDKHVMMFL